MKSGEIQVVLSGSSGKSTTIPEGEIPEETAVIEEFGVLAAKLYLLGKVDKQLEYDAIGTATNILNEMRHDIRTKHKINI